MITLPHLLNPTETAKLMAENFKALRLQAGYKRSTIAKHAGVSEASLKRFENTGQVSLKHLLRLSQAMGKLQEFCNIFAPTRPSSIAELRERASNPFPKRGKR